MRGKRRDQRSLLLVGSVGERIPASHPIRRIKALADQALVRLSGVFDAMYASGGRPSVPPERLLKSQLLIALFSVVITVGRSKRVILRLIAPTTHAGIRALFALAVRAALRG